MRGAGTDRVAVQPGADACITFRSLPHTGAESQNPTAGQCPESRRRSGRHGHTRTPSVARQRAPACCAASSPEPPAVVQPSAAEQAKLQAMADVILSKAKQTLQSKAEELQAQIREAEADARSNLLFKCATPFATVPRSAMCCPNSGCAVLKCTLALACGL